MNRDELKKLFPRASAYFLDRNSGTAPVVESDSSHAALGAGQVQGQVGGRFLVRVTSVRKRLLDEDNLCEKYHVDLCRYSGIIPGDEAGTAKIETGQRKARKGEQERTLIEIFEIKEVNP